MKTLLQFPPPRHPDDEPPPTETIWFSVFPDVTPRWLLEDLNWSAEQGEPS